MEASNYNMENFDRKRLIRIENYSLLIGILRMNVQKNVISQSERTFRGTLGAPQKTSFWKRKAAEAATPTIKVDRKLFGRLKTDALSNIVQSESFVQLSLVRVFN